MYHIAKARKLITYITVLLLAASVAYPPSSFAIGQKITDEAISRGLPSGVVKASDSLQSNPSYELPEKVASNLPDNASLISQELVTTENGEVYDVETGKPVYNEQFFGTYDTPADPLQKTSGDTFIPTPLREVREQLQKNNEETTEVYNSSMWLAQSSHSSSRHDLSPVGGAVHNVALDNNSYGAYWGTYNGTKAFYQKNGELFAQQAQGVIDVSQWQGDIDWDAVYASGNVDAAIIRIGYGQGNADQKAARNIEACRRLGIPFGFYLYSYSYDEETARKEANGTADLLQKFGVKNSDLKYPIYYDLEAWSWTGHKHPTEPKVYKTIVDTYYATLKARGYTNLGVYSYTSFLNGPLKDKSIWDKVNWVAQYGPSLDFKAWNFNFRGWQYSSSAKVSGIKGNVDVNAFGNKEAVTTAGTKLAALPKVTQLPEGDYYIQSELGGNFLDIEKGATHNGARLNTWAATDGHNQQFHVKPLGDGRYSIVAKNSQKSLDINGGNAVLGSPIVQWDYYGGTNQLWELRQQPNGYVTIASVKGRDSGGVLDIANASRDSGASIILWSFNGGKQQNFRFISAVDKPQVAFLVSSQDKTKVVDIPNKSLNADVPLDIWQKNSGINQMFVVEQEMNGFFAIKSLLTGLYLDISGGSTADGASIIQYSYTGGANQKWYLRSSAHGGYEIVSALSNKVIDVAFGSSANGAKIITYHSTGGKNQSWTLSTPQDQGFESTVGVEKPLQVNDLDTGTYILEARLNSRVLDYNARNIANDNRVIVNNYRNSGSQKFIVRRDSSGTYSIGAHNGGVLTMPQVALSVNPMIEVVADQQLPTQRWNLHRSSNGYYYFTSKAHPHYALTVREGVVLGVSRANFNIAQGFILKYVDFAQAIYSISSARSGLYIDVWNRSVKAGDLVGVWFKSASKNQNFAITQNAKFDGNYTIAAAHSSMLLDVMNNAKNPGSYIVQYRYTGGDNQQWYIQKFVGNKYALISKSANLPLGIHGSASPYRLELSSWSNGTVPLWIFTQ